MRSLIIEWVLCIVKLRRRIDTSLATAVDVSGFGVQLWLAGWNLYVSNGLTTTTTPIGAKVSNR